MVLTNAERQKRHRERLKAAAKGGGGLTPDLMADRDAVMADPIYPVPDGAARDQMPTFFGWNRYEWSVAPSPLVEFFGMRVAWEGWQAENQAMQGRMDEISRQRHAAAQAIVAECGQHATDLLRSSGQAALFEAYRVDPTLGQKRGRRKVVT